MSLSLGLITACLCGRKDGAELERGVSLHVLGQLMWTIHSNSEFIIPYTNNIQYHLLAITDCVEWDLFYDKVTEYYIG